MKEITGTVFNLQKFSIHDGIGIRTLVFLKGCPLKCIWCSNPESQKRSKEIMNQETKCIGCGNCYKVCDRNAIDKSDFHIIRERCDACGKCVNVCYTLAKKVVGTEMTVDEIIGKIEKDRVFYKNSGGGITVGGGEPLMQHEFAYELLKSCQERNIHTAIETCGYAKWEHSKRVFSKCDQVFFDLKCMDNEKHLLLTGVGNKLILDNARKLAKSGKEVVFRIPLVQGFNDGSNVEETGKFVKSISSGNNVKIEILPFHNFGKVKYRGLSRKYELENMNNLDKTIVNEYNRLLLEMGCSVIEKEER